VGHAARDPVLGERNDLYATRRHFWLRLLHRNSPARVVPVEANAENVVKALGALRPGRRWPPIDDLLTAIEREVSDQIGAPTPTDAARPIL
jgi:hypothetical protein